MGDFKWKSQQSFEDQTLRVSKSVYVTNFPESSTAKDLWKVCNDYGTVVDVFIPFKKLKAGKRFAFVRFIKVHNLERLIDNLCTIWIGKFHLHANMVRFQRPHKPTAFTPNGSNLGNSKGSFASVLKEGNVSPAPSDISKPALILNDYCIKEFEFSLSLMGKVKNVYGILNLYIILANEGFQNLKITYLGGLWVLLEMDSIAAKEKFLNHTGVGSWFSNIKQASNSFECDEQIVWVTIEGLPIKAWTSNSFSKIASLWGELMEWEDLESKTLASKHLCIKTKINEIINEMRKIIIQGKVFWIRAKERDAWVPTFQVDSQDDSSSNDGLQEEDNVEKASDKVDHALSDIDRVLESRFMYNDDPDQHTSNNNKCNKGCEGTHSEDPFKIYDLLKGQQNKESITSTVEPKFPLDSHLPITSKRLM
ncbi:RNA-directed DNA polymerase, eukaryota, nucleotide-binding alpha-beta plait domain protein [Tanacetum coccineum]